MHLYIGIAGIVVVCLAALAIMHLPLDVTDGKEHNNDTKKNK